MNQEFAETKKVSYSIDNELIAIGTTTWQTKNLTSVSISHSKIEMQSRVPELQTEEPKRKPLRLRVIIAIALSMGWSVQFTHPLPMAALACLFTAGPIWFINRYAHINRLNVFNAEKQHVQKLQKTWNYLKDNCPDIYSLVMGDASGKAIALTSPDATSVKFLHDQILIAMRSSVANQISSNIIAYDSSDMSLTKRYEIYCDYTISKSAKNS